MTREDAERIARNSGHSLGSWVDKACVGEGPLWVTRCHCGRVMATDTGTVRMSITTVTTVPLAQTACAPRSVTTTMREELAALEHDQWAAWAADIAKTEAITPARAERWTHLIATPYEQLTEAQKDQDREWADRVIEIVRHHSAGGGGA